MLGNVIIGLAGYTASIGCAGLAIYGASLINEGPSSRDRNETICGVVFIGAMAVLIAILTTAFVRS